MLDWMTLKFDASLLNPEARNKLLALSGRLIKLDESGQVEWESPTRVSIRSDSHRLTVGMGTYLTLTGSPARVDQADNVFGSSSVTECASKMIATAAREVGIELSRDLKLWKLTRLDVTYNYDLGGAAEVKQAMQALSMASGGRYARDTTSETVYWSKRSQRQSGKAYPKGPHMRYMVRKGHADMSPENLELTDRVLRLELSLRSKYFKEVLKHWTAITPDDLTKIHQNYFEPLIGSLEVVNMTDLKKRLSAVCQSTRQANTAYRLWQMIEQVGFEPTMNGYSRATRYRFQKIFLAAGLSWADLKSGKILMFRRRPIVLGMPVHSWDDLRESSKRVA